MKKKKSLALSDQGLNDKLRISFYLMSILPLLVCIYLVSNYILPNIGIRLDVAFSVVISIVIALIGFFLIKQVFNRVLSVSSEAKMIAAGDISRKIEGQDSDEVGDLGDALNQLTGRIRTNMEELNSYSERTSEINLEIQKRVLVLSNLLQISSLISQSAKLDDVLKVTTEKARLLASSDIAFLLYRQENEEAFSMKAAEGQNAQYLFSVKLEPQEELFERLTKINRPLILDKENIPTDNLNVDFQEKLKLTNALVIPVYLKGRVIAVFGIGNSQETFLYKKGDVELLDIFAKQVAIAVENDLLMRRVERLEIKDALTGLYNEEFIRSRLQEEIKRAIAYQRPCAFILLAVNEFHKFHQKYGSLFAESALKKIASLIKDSVTEIERVARFGDDEFAVVLPEKNKRQAQETAENIRKRIEFTFSEEYDPDKRLTVSASVSENPLDGIDAEELVNKARSLLTGSDLQVKNKVFI